MKFIKQQRIALFLGCATVLLLIPQTLISCGSGSEGSSGGGSGAGSETPAASKGADTPDAGGSGTTCLDNCTAPTSRTVSFSTVPWFEESTGCSVSSYSILKSKQNNQLTVIYRAKYASTGGITQLYAKRLLVSADGTLSVHPDDVTNPKNLIPGCFGNPDGITGFSFPAFARSTGTSDITHNVNVEEQLSHVRIQATCVNSAQSQTFNLDLSTLEQAPAATMISVAGVGPWTGKSAFIQANGTTLTSTGAAGTVVIPGNWSTSGTSPLGAIDQVVVEDGNGVYLRTSTSDIYYIKNSDLSRSKLSFTASSPKGARISGVGSLVFEGFTMYLVQDGAAVVTTNIQSAYGITGSTAADVIVQDDWNERLYSLNIAAGTTSQIGTLSDVQYTYNRSIYGKFGLRFFATEKVLPTSRDPYTYRIRISNEYFSQ